MTSEEMNEARTRSESKTDWARVQREIGADPEARTENLVIGKMIAKMEARRGRPVEGESKRAISLRVPESVLARWKATGPGWQTRMVERLSTP